MAPRNDTPHSADAPDGERPEPPPPHGDVVAVARFALRPDFESGKTPTLIRRILHAGPRPLLIHAPAATSPLGGDALRVLVEPIQEVAVAGRPTRDRSIQRHAPPARG